MARNNDNNDNTSGYRLPFSTVGGDFNVWEQESIGEYLDGCERRHMRRSTAVRGLAVA